MVTFAKHHRLSAFALALILIGMGVACSKDGTGSRSPIMGMGGLPALAPTVLAVTPAVDAGGVPISTLQVTATFSEAMAPLSGGAAFTLAAAAPAAQPVGVVTLNGAGTQAQFTLANTAPLAALTAYTASVTGFRSLATGLPLAAPFVWRFTTGAGDTTRPRVTLTVPATTVPGPTLNVPANAALTVAFSEAMAPATISAASFTLTSAGSPLPGSVAYAASTRTAVFTPAAPLTAGVTYQASLTSAAQDLAGNALAGNQAPLAGPSAYRWSFTAGPATAAGNLSVVSTSPVAGALAVSPATGVNATFSTASGLGLDPLTVNASTFTLVGPAPALTPVLAAAVTLDATTGKLATFTPKDALLAGGTYTATLGGGATGIKDLALPGNTLSPDFVWSFTVATLPANAPILVPLGAIAPFGAFGGSAGTTNMGINTVVNGDLGTTASSTLVTGFHDSGVGNSYTETPLNIGLVNGRIFTAAPPPTGASTDEGTAATFAVALAARAAALTAYNTLVALPGGPDPGAGNLANLVLIPGVYTALAGSFMIQGGDLTLDARGDGNAVFVFQMAKSLTVGGPGGAFPQSIILVNGAQPKNVYWQVGSAATINAAGGGTMVGTIIAQAGADLSTADNTVLLTVNGRVISLGAAVTMVNTIVNVPAQ